jgi:hypothetical protein
VHRAKEGMVVARVDGPPGLFISLLRGKLGTPLLPTLLGQLAPTCSSLLWTLTSPLLHPRLGCIGLYLPRASKNAAEDLHRRYKAFYRSIPRRNAWQWLKLALGSILLLPVRLVAGFSLLISMWAACRLLSLGVKIGDQGLECEWRRVLLRGMVKRASRVLLFILGFYSIAQNGAVYEEGELCSQIIVCNHVSYLVRHPPFPLGYCACLVPFKCIAARSSQ